jgi:hypothetical protein
MERLTHKIDNMYLYDVDDINVGQKLGELEDVLEKYGIENAEDLDKFIHHKDCQIEKWKQDYENCSKLEKSMSKEHQYCLDNWRACENELAELKQKTIVPKFNLSQTCFIIWENDIMSAQIEKIIIKLSKDEEENSIFYSITNQYGYALRFPEEQIFATKEEAEQKLAEIKGEK